jgi:hypothetical protein
MAVGRGPPGTGGTRALALFIGLWNAWDSNATTAPLILGAVAVALALALDPNLSEISGRCGSADSRSFAAESSTQRNSSERPQEGSAISSTRSAFEMHLPRTVVLA